jgi:hypothetical protein
VNRLELWWELRIERSLQCFGPPFSTAWHHRLIRGLGDFIYRLRRSLAGADVVETVGGPDHLRLTSGSLSLSTPELDIEWSGACPVQGEGTLAGRKIYYRSRGEGWQFHVAPEGGEVFDDGEWVYERRDYFFPDGGWVTSDVSEACVREAVNAWVSHEFHRKAREHFAALRVEVDS